MSLLCKIKGHTWQVKTHEGWDNSTEAKMSDPLGRPTHIYSFKTFPHCLRCGKKNPNYTINKPTQRNYEAR